jgi:hypothetical protein
MSSHRLRSRRRAWRPLPNSRRHGRSLPPPSHSRPRQPRT